MDKLALLKREDGSLPDLSEVETALSDLIGQGALAPLDEVRRQAEAHGLYEHRTGNAERERYFGQLRLLSEAAIGVISFVQPDVIPRTQDRGVWRTLAAGLERGVLLDVALRTPTLKSGSVAAQVREEGYANVPGSVLGLPTRESLPWKEARVMALDQGLTLTDLPPDTATIRRREKDRWENYRARIRREHALERLERMEERKRTTALAKETGPKIDLAYSYLRRCLQALHDAQQEIPRGDQREALNHVFMALHDAEDWFGAALRTP